MNMETQALFFDVVGEDEEEKDEKELVTLHFTERQVPLKKGTHTVGRHPTSDIVLSSPSVSGNHAQIQVEKSFCWVSDTKSRNGTRLSHDGSDANIVTLTPNQKYQIPDKTFVIFGDIRCQVVFASAKLAEPLKNGASNSNSQNSVGSSAVPETPSSDSHLRPFVKPEVGSFSPATNSPLIFDSTSRAEKSANDEACQMRARLMNESTQRYDEDDNEEERPLARNRMKNVINFGASEGKSTDDRHINEATLRYDIDDNDGQSEKGKSAMEEATLRYDANDNDEDHNEPEKGEPKPNVMEEATLRYDLADENEHDNQKGRVKTKPSAIEEATLRYDANDDNEEGPVSPQRSPKRKGVQFTFADEQKKQEKKDKTNIMEEATLRYDANDPDDNDAESEKKAKPSIMMEATLRYDLNDDKNEENVGSAKRTANIMEEATLRYDANDHDDVQPEKNEKPRSSIIEEATLRYDMNDHNDDEEHEKSATVLTNTKTKPNPMEEATLRYDMNDHNNDEKEKLEKEEKEKAEREKQEREEKEKKQKEELDKQQQQQKRKRGKRKKKARARRKGES